MSPFSAFSGGSRPGSRDISEQTGTRATRASVKHGDRQGPKYKVKRRNPAWSCSLGSSRAVPGVNVVEGAERLSWSRLPVFVALLESGPDRGAAPLPPGALLAGPWAALARSAPAPGSASRSCLASWRSLGASPTAADTNPLFRRVPGAPGAPPARGRGGSRVGRTVRVLPRCSGARVAQRRSDRHRVLGSRLLPVFKKG